jgi:hypothetical protein
MLGMSKPKGLARQLVWVCSDKAHSIALQIRCLQGSNKKLSRLSNHLDNMLVTVKGCLLSKVLVSITLIAEKEDVHR